MTAVLSQIRSGVASVPDLATRTGLAPDLVRAVVDRLVRTGRVEPWRAPGGCGPSGCRDCASSGCPLTSLA
ncbi:MAG: FeoC-like transcriptional regulator [Propionicimonas sp.]|nr:FeoC-like transcriptional regulator [Propionicimonas sp.]